MRLQLDVGLPKRDPRWHCERSFQMRLAGGAAELFFIDTSPFITSYHNVSWANQLGNALAVALSGVVIICAEHSPMIHEMKPETECRVTSRVVQVPTTCAWLYIA